MKKFILALALVLWVCPAWAQSTVKVCLPTANNNCNNVSSTNPFPMASTPGSVTPVTLTNKTVTTGGVAVIASAPGNHNKGGFLTNPKGATADLCIDEIGTASGTTSNGDTTCIIAGQSYTITPNPLTTVSVITSDSSHPFSGQGLN